MVVHELPNDLTFSQFIEKAATKLVVIDFYAEWCGPCRMISPHIERLSGKYLQVVFIKVNVELCRRSFFASSLPLWFTLSTTDSMIC